MRYERLGERACIVRDLPVEPWIAAAALNRERPAGLEEALPAWETLGLFFDPGAFELEDAIRIISSASANEPAPAMHEVPCCYELGPDLHEVASSLQLQPGDLIREHTGALYTCRAIGFAPGFPYLAGLPERLSGLGRLASPRTSVPGGSVAITGAQCGIYPAPLPGGWRLIGRTPLTIVDLASEYFPIAPGDHVRFRPLSKAEFDQLAGRRL